MRQLWIFAAIFVVFSVNGAQADYAQGCKDMLNKKENGEYVHWKSSSTLRDEAKTNMAIQSYYSHKFIEEIKATEKIFFSILQKGARLRLAT